MKWSRGKPPKPCPCPSPAGLAPRDRGSACQATSWRNVVAWPLFAFPSPKPPWQQRARRRVALLR
eukprot:11224816-Lingulodinium_polyedra.AAC.1